MGDPSAGLLPYHVVEVRSIPLVFPFLVPLLVFFERVRPAHADQVEAHLIREAFDGIRKRHGVYQSTGK
ncbi:MAG: hypothetical protein A3A86_02595 [Elusimicrobia bacterium RIFCSPLOWO2_01_FULL_60_11]|nr:MAG: hypothetical protein A3A86_02595 [Elusimicrobia bacterium RIFCSPLOWO2_01_FULL_60_11]